MARNCEGTTPASFEVAAPDVATPDRKGINRPRSPPSTITPLPVSDGVAVPGRKGKKRRRDETATAGRRYKIPRSSPPLQGGGSVADQEAETESALLTPPGNDPHNTTPNYYAQGNNNSHTSQLCPRASTPICNTTRTTPPPISEKTKNWGKMGWSRRDLPDNPSQAYLEWKGYVSRSYPKFKNEISACIDSMTDETPRSFIDTEIFALGKRELLERVRAALDGAQQLQKMMTKRQIQVIIKIMSIDYELVGLTPSPGPELTHEALLSRLLVLAMDTVNEAKPLSDEAKQKLDVLQLLVLARVVSLRWPIDIPQEDARSSSPWPMPQEDEIPREDVRPSSPSLPNAPLACRPVISHGEHPSSWSVCEKQRRNQKKHKRRLSVDELNDFADEATIHHLLGSVK